MSGGLREEDAREREARAALERVRREGEALGTSSLARAGGRLKDHLAARDADRDDAVEVWGRRLGRGLSVAGALVLAYLLGRQLHLW